MNSQESNNKKRGGGFSGWLRGGSGAKVSGSGSGAGVSGFGQKVMTAAGGLSATKIVGGLLVLSTAGALFFVGNNMFSGYSSGFGGSAARKARSPFASANKSYYAGLTDSGKAGQTSQMLSGGNFSGGNLSAMQFGANSALPANAGAAGAEGVSSTEADVPVNPSADSSEAGVASPAAGPKATLSGSSGFGSVTSGSRGSSASGTTVNVPTPGSGARDAKGNLAGMKGSGAGMSGGGSNVARRGIRGTPRKQLAITADLSKAVTLGSNMEVNKGVTTRSLETSGMMGGGAGATSGGGAGLSAIGPGKDGGGSDWAAPIAPTPIPNKTGGGKGIGKMPLPEGWEAAKKRAKAFVLAAGAIIAALSVLNMFLPGAQKWLQWAGIAIAGLGILIFSEGLKMSNDFRQLDAGKYLKTVGALVIAYGSTIFATKGNFLRKEIKDIAGGPTKIIGNLATSIGGGAIGLAIALGLIQSLFFKSAKEELKKTDEQVKEEVAKYYGENTGVKSYKYDE
ncbi:MAG: hypothetical protein NTW04_02340 [Elusimicrobia bacterium]|nr:hypothetical protein [Elusimicrobiota bacterium]